MIIKEDGTGVADANSYITIADLKQYAGLRGSDVALIDDGKLVPLIIKAMDYIELKNYKGSKSNVGQSLKWPRQNLYDTEGELLNANDIPSELVKAQCELAILANEIDLNPITKAGPQVTKKKVEGLEVTYSETNSSSTVIPQVNRLLAPFVKGNSLRMIRA